MKKKEREAEYRKEILQGKSEFEQVATRVSVVSIIGNLILSGLKLLAGFLAHSNAMISDAIHSASDVFSTFVVIIGIKLSSKASDKEHPYGHERMECVAAIVLAIVLLITGIFIADAAIGTIRTGNYESLQPPGVLALAAAIISIVSKEAMYWYTYLNAKKIDSSALKADAWHHRSDALSSVGALIGIEAARLGYPVMDSVASLVIFVFIAKAAYDIFVDAINKMVDRSCDEVTQSAIRECVLTVPDVEKIDVLRTRIFGNVIYVDLEIAVDSRSSLKKAHNIAEEVHSTIEREFPKIKHIMVHVNPQEVESVEEK